MSPRKAATPSPSSEPTSAPSPVPVQGSVPVQVQGPSPVPVQGPSPAPSSPAQPYAVSSTSAGSNGAGAEGPNARDFLTNTFIRKEDLRQGGRRRLVIRAVEKSMGLPGRNGQPAREELVLVFHDETRLGLRAQVNLRRLIEAFGERTATWINQTIDVYFSPDVVNPGGGAPGGIRIQIPTSASSARPFVSELETSDTGF